MELHAGLQHHAQTLELFAKRCLMPAEWPLLETEHGVRRAVSFAIRLAAKKDTDAVCDFLAQHIPPADSAATWVLCDAIRSMGTKQLPAFKPLLPQYEQWAAAPALDAKARRSVESAIKTLRG